FDSPCLIDASASSTNCHGTPRQVSRCTCDLFLSLALSPRRWPRTASDGGGGLRGTSQRRLPRRPSIVNRPIRAMSPANSACEVKDMSEIDRPADAPIGSHGVGDVTEVRRPRLLQLNPDMLREMADRTEQSRERVPDSRQSKRF